MTSHRTRGITAALGASALVSAALAGVPMAASATTPSTTPSTSTASSSTQQSACVNNAMSLAAPLVKSRKKPGSARERGVNNVIEQIRQQSENCIDILFRGLLRL